MFYVGQKVVCVDDAIRNIALGWRGQLKAGAIYVIRWCGPHIHHCTGERYVGVRLEGINRIPPDVPFIYDRFRPLVFKSTDTGMAILKEILERESFKDRVRA